MMLGAELEKQGSYLIGDCIGRGNFGTVHSGFNLDTGELVAVKVFKRSNRHSNTLMYIMQEIELLKELSHQNIVKYLGLSLTSEQLCVYMEFCESGSLKVIAKKFGNFSEKLTAVYMSQVLQGLVYLHGQGIIHRDVKAANILTNKRGQTKIADFGIASRTDEPGNPMMGSPYWMAPEIINLNDPVPESDVWLIFNPSSIYNLMLITHNPNLILNCKKRSVGCTVIELIEGNPPYWNMTPMSALYHIVQDEVPPIPQSASVLLKSFLLECFRKDHNLRINASKLITHRWVNHHKNECNEKRVNIQSNSVEEMINCSSPIKIKGSDHACLTLVERFDTDKIDHNTFSDTEDWNVGLDLADVQSIGDVSLVAGCDYTVCKRCASLLLQEFIIFYPTIEQQKKSSEDLNSVRNKSKYSNTSFLKDGTDDFIEDFLKFDGEDFVLNRPSMDSTQNSNHSMTNEFAFDDVMDSEFWNEDEYVEKNQKSVWIGSIIERFLSCLRSNNVESLRVNIRELNELFKKTPSHKKYLITHHCQLPIIEELEKNKDKPELVSALLKFINEVSVDNEEFLESLCLLGTIPSILHFTGTEYSYDIRSAASLFVKNLCVAENTTLTQMFMSCRGLDTLVSYFKEEYPKYDLARNATDSIDSLLCLQCSTPRSTICSILVSKGLVPKMIRSLFHFTSSSCASIYSDIYATKVVNMFLTFSVAGANVSELFIKNEDSISGAFDTCYCRRYFYLLTYFHAEELIKVAPALQPETLLKLLKCLKNISMNPDTLDVLHRAGAIKFLVTILERRRLANYREIQNQVLNIAFNLCRINRDKLYVAIDCGLLAHLLPFVDSNSPVRQFALPLLCEAAHVGQYCRQIVHMQGILNAYIRLLKDANWQVSALDSIMCWYETSSEQRIMERVLLVQDSIDKLVGILETCCSRDIPSVLSNLKIIATRSPEICVAIGEHKKRVIVSLCKMLHDPEAQVRLSVLRLLLPLMDGIKFGNNDLNQIELLEKTVRLLCQEDVAILVREIARKLRIVIRDRKNSMNDSPTVCSVRKNIEYSNT